MSATVPFPSDDLTPREVATLAGVPVRTVEKAIETKVVAAKPMRCRLKGGSKRALGADAVVILTALDRSGLGRLELKNKKALAKAVREMWKVRASGGLGMVEFAPGAYLELDKLAGPAAEAARRYLAARNAHVVSDPDILGGTPVVRGTRVSVYALLGRVQEGEKAQEIAEEHPGLTPEAVEAAVLYARTHPLRGKPSGRPWRREEIDRNELPAS
ncbi:DUF433 domain-containing protein [Parvularcula oceani]|uniref:DUF433 domain-containing protein n=1 Tax=Parvularcula oceani TaxID=1247963 RepID=UPI00069113C4|nr:DUF433 domain-containing protein [Parvularcula oceani]